MLEASRNKLLSRVEPSAQLDSAQLNKDARVGPGVGVRARRANNGAFLPVLKKPQGLSRAQLSYQRVLLRFPSEDIERPPHRWQNS